MFYSVFRKDILEYINENEICITKFELAPSDVLEIEVNWASHMMEYHRELSGLDCSLPSPTGSFSSDTVYPSISSMSTPGRDSASFVVWLPQIQITGPTFSGLEMSADHLSYRNFLSRFENCVVGVANDAERLNVLKCSLTDRALRLINHLSCTDANY